MVDAVGSAAECLVVGQAGSGLNSTLLARNRCSDATHSLETNVPVGQLEWCEFKVVKSILALPPYCEWLPVLTASLTISTDEFAGAKNFNINVIDGFCDGGISRHDRRRHGNAT